MNSTLDWKAYRFGYEFDFVTKNRGFGGFILEAKYTDVLVRLQSPLLNVDEFTHAKAPIPAIGGIVRVYVVPNISITGEVTGFTLPKNAIKGDSGHYLDVDIYGTLNFTNNIGVQGGYRPRRGLHHQDRHRQLHVQGCVYRGGREVLRARFGVGDIKDRHRTLRRRTKRGRQA